MKKGRIKPRPEPERVEWMGGSYRPYPPQPLWEPLAPGKLRSAWHEALGGKTPDPLSLYIHIPPEGLRRPLPPQKVPSPYLPCLKRELDLLGIPRKPALNSVYIGSAGPGSVCAMSPAAIRELFRWLSGRFSLREVRQFTAEVGFAELDQERAALLAKNGVDRVTGIFPFQEDSPAGKRYLTKYAEGVRLCRRAGIKTINVDLAARPEERSGTTLKRNLKFVRSLKPSAVDLPGDWDARLAVPGARHARNLQLGLLQRFDFSVLGLGWGAGSRIRGRFLYETAGSCRLYLRQLAAGRPPVYTGAACGREHEMRGFLIEFLEDSRRIDRRKFKSIFGIDPQEVFPKEWRSRKFLEPALKKRLAIRGSIDARDAAVLKKAGLSKASLGVELAELALRAGNVRGARRRLDRALSGCRDAGLLEAGAKLCTRMGEHERAFELLCGLTARFPDDAALWIGRARAATRTGRRAAAIDALARAGGLDPGPEEMLLAADVFKSVGPDRRSLPLLKELLKRFPEDAALWIGRAESALETGNRKAAASALARAERLDPPPGLLRRMAGSLGRLGEGRRALAIFDGLIAQTPRDAELWIDRADTALRAADAESAAHSLARAERLRPGPEGLRRAARIYEELGRPGRALALLGRLLRKNPSDADLWIERARQALHGGDQETALDSLARAERLKPSPGGLRGAAWAYGELGEHGRALKIVERLLESSPEDAALWVDRSYLSLQLGDREAALKALTRAERLKPPPALLGRMAGIRRDLGEHGRALEFSNALVSGGMAAEALARTEKLRRIALMHQERGEHAPAIAIFKRLTRNKAAAPLAFREKGICEYLNGRPGAALDDLREAIRRDPGMMPAYLDLGVILTSENRETEARKVYDRAIKTPCREDGRPYLEMIRKNRLKLLRGGD